MQPTQTTHKQDEEATAIHVLGDFQLQNNPDCAKFTPPTQVRRLIGPNGQGSVLDTEEAVLWQFAQKVGLPVATSHTPENYMRMYQMYGDPNKHSGGNAIVFPKQFTEDAYGGGHPCVNFSRGDTLAFFASEAVLMSDFPRLFVGTFNDYEKRAREEERVRVIWGKTYERPAFAPGNEKYVREVFVISSDEKPINKTRPASEGWVCSDKLLS